jgi:hypothetical protein
MTKDGDVDTGDGDGAARAERVVQQRARIDRLHAAADRQHALLRAHRGDPGGQAVGGPAGARRDALDRLPAEGERLHAEDQRLRAARDRGVTDRAAHTRWFAALDAHRAALRRFRAGRERPRAPRKAAGVVAPA